MVEQSPSIFRQKALERISSPEQLNDYLKVTNPGIWTLMASVIILLIGLFVWSTVGKLETVVDGVASVNNGKATIVVTENSQNDIRAGMPIRIEDKEFFISSVAKDDYRRTIAYGLMDKNDGKYDVKIVTESIHPIKFLFN